SVANRDEVRAQDYIEKIVQYPFRLPPLQPIHREAEVTSGLRRVAADAEIEWNAVVLQKRSPAEHFLDLIPESDLTTLRAIHRVVHQFDATLSMIGPNEVNFIDLLLLTYLRVQYPSLYEALPTWRADLTRSLSQLMYVNRGSGDKRSWHEDIAAALPEKTNPAVVSKPIRVTTLTTAVSTSPTTLTATSASPCPSMTSAILLSSRGWRS
ncbi:P-loop NTPase fold protein, partial [Streptomyces sp. NPDC059071]|uniref:P-loop NTPase fold protein n=1 Tax=Streptomyces sp. NPDC059071 TaxID=3346714 RepID=UPI00369BB2D7